MSVPGFAQDVQDRVRALIKSDSHFRAALPSPDISAMTRRDSLRQIELLTAVIEGYRDRPALGRRATELAADPVTGKTARRLLDRFETISYHDLLSRVRALAAFWYHHIARPLRPDDMLCVIAASGFDFTTIDIASIHLGAVLVPVQAKAPAAQLLSILDEVQPRWLAASVDSLDSVVELVLAGVRPVGILLFDYHPEADDEREALERAKTILAESGHDGLIVTLSDAIEQGGRLAPAPAYLDGDMERRVSTIIYTSGSTGQPKGAMWPEKTMTGSLRAFSSLPSIVLHYAPMNHSIGRPGVFATLCAGGTCYFTARSDLSEVLNDISLVRPTQMFFVPRVCELLFQQYQIELDRLKAGADDVGAVERSLILDMRERVLGGRLLSAAFGTAPLSPALKTFMDQCLGFPLVDGYGSTECGRVLLNSQVLRPSIIDYRLDDVPELGYFNTDKPHPRGELWVKSSTMFLGYFKRPDVTASVMTADGFYKTGDIMAEIAPDQLVYLDRRNNVQKLAQGEFVAIAQLETLFTNGDARIRQVFLYGTSDRSFLLGVVVPSEDAVLQSGIDPEGETRLKAELQAAIKNVALKEGLKAYEMPRDFIVELSPFTVGNGLLADVGKYQRPNLRKHYGPRLERLYEQIAAGQADELMLLRRNARDMPLLDTVIRAVRATLGLDDVDLSGSTKFSRLGGDSLSALSCSLLLEEIYDVDIPAAVINGPGGTLQHIVDHIARALSQDRGRPTFASVHGRGATEIRAADLKLEKFLDAPSLDAGHAVLPARQDVRTVLVTGATGFLGRFLCLEWLQRMAAVGGRVICITRGQDAADAYRRIADMFESGDADLRRHFSTLADGALTVLRGDLSEPDLGLSRADWLDLAERVDLIVHPAALVNHLLPYSQLFGPNVVGTAELIRLAITHRLKPFINLSTATVPMLPSLSPVDEDADVRIAMPVHQPDNARYADGYTLSKWAGEVLLREAHDRYRLPVSVFRSSMILAHEAYAGQINVPDVFTRLLFSVIVTGLAPRSFYAGDGAAAHYDGLPVNFTAAAISALGAGVLSGYRSYHVVNPHDDGVSLDTIVGWIAASGRPIEFLDDYAQWITRLEPALRSLPERQRNQSILPIIDHFGQPAPAVPGMPLATERFRADLDRFAPEGARTIPHLTRAFALKYLSDLRALGMV
ncbi:hypothetical protein WP12_06715 [Sphingomonas sp. SRS2]|nr:hypothetical protein WP12_06715 [Sphingomonas sp. SRS2]